MINWKGLAFREFCEAKLQYLNCILTQFVILFQYSFSIGLLNIIAKRTQLIALFLFFIVNLEYLGQSVL